ncbi:MAG: 30S ribosomal protein S3ae [Candidatus Diapherotrites archaeon]|nr:30S ribosomal protein S3ae [Candidatus Diapherotrites archaeon]
MPSIIEEKSDTKEKQPKAGKKARTVDKWKKKQWYQLVAPAEFDKKVIGETVAEKPKNLLGRVVKVNLDDLTGQRLKRHISVLFKVSGVEGNQARTTLVGHGISGGFMNRLVRRRMSKMEVTQTVQTVDGNKVKVKSIALSARKLRRKQESAIIREIRDKVEKGAAKKTFSQFSQELVFGVLASKMFKQLAKIAPLKRFETVKSQLLEEKGAARGESSAEETVGRGADLEPAKPEAGQPEQSEDAAQA